MKGQVDPDDTERWASWREQRGRLVVADREVLDELRTAGRGDIFTMILREQAFAQNGAALSVQSAPPKLESEPEPASVLGPEALDALTQVIQRAHGSGAVLIKSRRQAALAIQALEPYFSGAMPGCDAQGFITRLRTYTTDAC